MGVTRGDRCDMRRLVFILLVSSLALTVILVQNGAIPTARAASPDIFQGNLVLTVNNVTVIQGLFNINGSVTVENNATLILRNAVVNFMQTSGSQFGMTFQNPVNGNPRLIVENATLTSGGYVLWVSFIGNSSCTADHVAWADPIHFALQDYSSMSMSDSNVYAIINYGGFFEASNSTMSYLQILDNSASAIVSSSYIASLTSFYSGAQCILSDSNIGGIYTRFDGLAQLVNSTYSSYDPWDTSRITVSWYLDVHVVDEVAQNVPYANVTAAYANATVAESKLTDINGLTRLTLMQKMLNASGQYPAGNYTVEATHGIYSNNTSINMTGNQEITLTLNGFIVPEFQSLLILPLFMTLTLVVVIISRRRHSMKTKPLSH